MTEAFKRGFWRGLGWPVAWLLGWGCYWLGDGVSRVMQLREWEWPSSLLYPVYNRLMLWSCSLCDAFALGIWKRTPPDAGSTPAPDAPA
jgi:hypothetical protein